MVEYYFVAFWFLFQHLDEMEVNTENIQGLRLNVCIA
jgi:hypothetical protein